MNTSAKKYYSLFLLKAMFIVLLLLVYNNATSQISIKDGMNCCNVRNNQLLQNQQPLFTFHTGFSARFYPFRNMPNLSIQHELLFNRKGYRQNLDKHYIFQFSYVSFPTLLCYTPVEFLSISAGVEFSRLLSTNIREGTETYNRHDIGVILDISYFDNRRIGIYTRITYGLVPMLDYYAFDELGNFTDEIHDLKNICLSVGIIMKIHHAKIPLYK